MAQYRMSNFQSVPPVIKNLIIINLLMWIAQLTFGQSFTSALSLHYYKSEEFGIWQLLTHMFLHAPNMFAHIFFNMFSLWMFGSMLENLWGAKKFLIFYLLCGLGAGCIQALSSIIELGLLTNQFEIGKITQAEYIERESGIYHGIVLGASGAVMGVLAAFAYLFPNTTLFVFPFPFPVKAKYLIGGLILLDVFGGINPRFGSGVAHFAHIGGAIFGFLLVFIMNKSNRKTFY